MIFRFKQQHAAQRINSPVTAHDWREGNRDLLHNMQPLTRPNVGDIAKSDLTKGRRIEYNITMLNDRFTTSFSNVSPTRQAHQMRLSFSSGGTFSFFERRTNDKQNQ